MKFIRLLYLIIFFIAGCGAHSYSVLPGGPGENGLRYARTAPAFFTPVFAPRQDLSPAAADRERPDMTGSTSVSREAGVPRFPVFRAAEKGSAEKAQPAEDDSDELNETEEEPEVAVSDPLEPFNRAMFQFNDKLYFWVLKPVAQGYQKVVPETARTSVSHLFENARFPIRFVNNLLQLNIEGALTELGRFAVNTLWGIGGLLDPASREEVAIGKSDADLGQTLGMYGIGPGFYVVWPVLGPSSARDSVRIAGEYFLDPVSYVNPLYASFGVRTFETVNDTSLRIGDYEALKEAALDPYVALRSAYFQYREGKIKKPETRTEPQKPAGVK